MTYEHIVTGTFLSRPNRFIAHIRIGEKDVVCHVKNTGRCRELLIPGVKVVLEYHPEAVLRGRRTEYDLIAVYKGGRLINMDSQAPNKAALEWIKTSPQAVLDGFGGMDNVRREVAHGDSRFDLAFTLIPKMEGNGDSGRGGVSPDRGIKALMEVKGVTLEEGGMAMFPDAPTQRGVKHLHGLVKACREGYEAYVLFVIQMEGIHGFKPNDITHPAFGQALRAAAGAGVHVLAWDCTVTPDSMRIRAPVPVLLD